MITYDPLLESMKWKGISAYTLIKDYFFCRGTLDLLKQKRNISTATLNDLCNNLECEEHYVLQIIPKKD